MEGTAGAEPTARRVPAATAHRIGATGADGDRTATTADALDAAAAGAYPERRPRVVGPRPGSTTTGAAHVPPATASASHTALGSAAAAPTTRGGRATATTPAPADGAPMRLVRPRDPGPVACGRVGERHTRSPHALRTATTLRTAIAGTPRPRLSYGQLIPLSWNTSRAAVVVTTA